MPSSATPGWRPSRPGWAWALVTALVHLAVVLAWWHPHSPPEHRGAARQLHAPVPVFLRPGPRPASLAPPPPPLRVPERTLATPQRQMHQVVRTGPMPRQTQATQNTDSSTQSVPADPATASDPGASPPAGAASPDTLKNDAAGQAPSSAPGTTASAVPLNLQLPSSAAGRPPWPGDANASRQVRADPRSHTPHLRAEQRLARALGGVGGLSDESRGLGRRRIRQGTGCVNVHDSRAAQINPFDPSTRDIKLVEPCR